MKKFLVRALLLAGLPFVLTGITVWRAMMPPAPVQALETLEAVVAQGRLYAKADIDAKVAEYRVHYEGIIFDRLSVGLAKAALRRTAADAH